MHTEITTRLHVYDFEPTGGADTEPELKLMTVETTLRPRRHSADGYLPLEVVLPHMGRAHPTYVTPSKLLYMEVDDSSTPLAATTRFNDHMTWTSFYPTGRYARTSTRRALPALPPPVCARARVLVVAAVVVLAL
eukprot:GHVU01160537.1.p2 GENE.GHVU01160537.1~~GHVU01160537.1.p2  ORF type:complete len:135 (-),score=6.35 GHVU01160537.1:1262-1666(-)